MTFESIIRDELQKTLVVLKRKDPVNFIAVQKKICQIASCDERSILHFKNLKGDMSYLKRVHIGSFVLTFELKDHIIFFDSLKHHDDAYC
jgi:mRNA-degrading endonuclease RelE of RelBE toxin-antitoxin system